jgi:O-acetyl-ADP-ribose deacetylase (regulator of RNase III)
MTQLKYIKGDATQPVGPGPKVICHCCNDIGGWGSGFVLALNARWPEPQRAYRKWFAERDGFRLGAARMVAVEPDLWVANIIGQHRTIQAGEATPIRYDALEGGFKVVRDFCLENQATVHMPRLGAGLARGDWRRIEEIVKRIFIIEGEIDATVYDLS